MKKLTEIYPRKTLEIEKYYVLHKKGLYVGNYSEIKDGENYCFITKTPTGTVLRLYKKIKDKDKSEFEDIFIKEFPDWDYYITTYYSLNIIKFLLMSKIKDINE